MYVCIYIMLYNKFKKAGTANRVSFLNTETTEEEETAFSREQFLPLEPGHCITATPITTISELMACKFSSPSQKYISSVCEQDWQNGVRTWRRVTWFFFVWGTAEKEVARSQWWRLSGMRQTGMLLWWGYCSSSGVQAFRACAEWGNSVLRSSLVFKFLFNFSQVMDFFLALDTS